VETVQRKAVQFLKENESIDSALGRYVWGQAIRFFNNLETNKEWQAFIEEHKDQWVKMVLEEWEGKLIDGDTLDWARLMDILIDRFNVLGNEILLNPDKQAPFERFFLLRSIPWLQKLNPLIDSVVGQELSRYSPDEITQIVRGKMYYDLQMVRINGSLVGAVLGGLFYGLTTLVKGVIG
jgi:membrane protein-like protein